MSLTSEDDPDKKSGSKKRSWLQEHCSICKFGSPKYWQLMLNDIPLIVCIPSAYNHKTADVVLILITLSMSCIDVIFMLTYLSHEEELSLDAQDVYRKVLQRNEEREEAIAKIEEQSSSSEDEERVKGDDKSDGGEDHERLEDGSIVDPDQNGTEN